MKLATFSSLLLLCGLGVCALPTAMRDNIEAREDPCETSVVLRTCTAIKLKTTKDKKDISFTFEGDGGVNVNGTIVDVDCQDDANCKALGPLFMKIYNPDEMGSAPAERKVYDKIGELRAAGKIGKQDLTVMAAPPKDFASLRELDVFKKAKDDDERKVVANSALKLAVAEGKTYIDKFGLLHKTNTNQSVRFKEENGKLTAAKILDWSKYEEVTDSGKAAAAEKLTAELTRIFSHIRK